MMPKKYPIVGIVIDSLTGDGSGYVLNTHHYHALTTHKAIVVAISPNTKAITPYVQTLDGLLITGGGYDMPPSSYRSLKHHQSIYTNETLSACELSLTKAFLETKKPILAIGAGQELLAVALGGNLIQDIPSQVEKPITHMQTTPLSQPCHKVVIKQDTLLHQIIGESVIDVNSIHHQATRDVPEDVIINATAPDAIIEGIEYPVHPFCLGVIWHPEYLTSSADNAIFHAFVKAMYL